MNALPPVLLVDDDEESLFLIKKLLAQAKVANPIRTFRDGEDVIEHLRTACAAAAGHLLRSGLMLLDVKMPRLSGFDVLAWIRKQPLLKNLVVVMLSTSEEAKDLERATELGAHTYLVKYPTAATLAALVRLVDDGPALTATPS
ncbi:MAG: response regulator [Opitutaceae bacterium]|nr:response regulator [Opitutaceae bacterium]